MASSAELAEAARTAAMEIFNRWDSDGGGTLDRGELAVVIYNNSPSASDQEIDALLNEMDRSGDGEVDPEEFLEWLTNRRATKTVGLDGWIEPFNLEAVLRPLFSAFDRQQSGAILQREFKECSRILGNSLRLHPLAGMDQLAWDWTGDDRISSSDEVNFEEFVGWQIKILEKAGVPNNQLPSLLQELADAMRTIFDIENIKGAGGGASSAEVALQSNIARVAEATRKVYTCKRHLLDTPEAFVPKTKDDIEISAWHMPPSPVDMQDFARFCAQEHGVRLQEIKPVEDSELRAIRSRKESVDAGRRASRRFSSMGRTTSLRTEVAIAVGRLDLIIPDVNDGSSETPPPWFVKLYKQGEWLYFRLDRSKGTRKPWSVLENKSEFDIALQRLPLELKFFSLLKAQSLMGEKLSWKAVQTAFDNAMDMEFIQDEVWDKFEAHITEAIEEEVFDEGRRAEVTDMGKAMDEAIYEYMVDEVKMSPLDVLSVLSELELLTVSDPVWAHLVLYYDDPASPRVLRKPWG
mmetsp:Transcript_95604/g.169775  ORF Transcript_95604/g.169775 Transcript_95604/m.169775 type:complete len:521 (+) Transcript_95604:87-1649(+)